MFRLTFFIWCVIFTFCSSLLVDEIVQKPKTCRHGWLRWKNTCFMFSVDKENWTNAELRCRALGHVNGHLVEIMDAETNTFIKNHLKILHFSDHDKSYYIGLSDVAQTNTWEWIYDRIVPSFSDWGVGQPELNDEHCAAFFGHYGFNWHDVYCNGTLQFICQEDAY